MDASDKHHRPCADLLTSHPGPLLVPDLVITEVMHFVGSRLGSEPEVRLLGDFAAGVMTVEHVQPSDWMRIAQLVWRYQDLPLGTVDASVIAIAERLGIIEVATIDLRHFRVVKPAHVAAFTLLPYG